VLPKLMNLETSAEFAKQEAYCVDFSAEIGDISYVGAGEVPAVEYGPTGLLMEGLPGLGVRFSSEISLADRHLGLRIVPSYGGVELLNAEVSVDDEVVYFAVPELLPDPAYGINTVTMMQDLQNMGANLGEEKSISFNFFDLVEIIKEGTTISEADQKKIEDAGKVLVKAIEVEKDGKRDIKVNKTNTKCTVYKVTIPQKALEKWMNTVEEVMGSVNYAEIMEKFFKKMNLPDYLVQELSEEVSRNMGWNFDGMYDMLDDLGDVELEVCVSKGKISAVFYEDKVDGSDVEIALYLGGGKVYADNVSLELNVDNNSIVVKSKGDHTAKNDVFTDSTEIAVTSRGRTEEYEISTRFDPKAKGQNLTIKVESKDFVMEMDTKLVLEKEKIQLDDWDFAVEADGVRLELEFEYTLTPYENRSDVGGARLLSDMTQQDLVEIVYGAEEKAAIWIMDVVEQIPFLKEFM